MLPDCCYLFIIFSIQASDDGTHPCIQLFLHPLKSLCLLGGFGEISFLHRAFDLVQPALQDRTRRSGRESRDRFSQLSQPEVVDLQGSIQEACPSCVPIRLLASGLYAAGGRSLVVVELPAFRASVARGCRIASLRPLAQRGPQRVVYSELGIQIRAESRPRVRNLSQLCNTC
jgi:hypothetical protein